MSDLASPPASESLPPAQPDTASPRRPSRRRLWIILGSIGAALVLCVAIVAVLIGTSLLRISTEQTAITPVLTQFMQAMLQRDAESAYQLFSSRAQRQTPIATINDMLEGPNFVLFKGYQSVAIEATNLTSSVNTNPDMPQGSVAEVSGTITYADGLTDSLRATLEKEDGMWHLFFITVTVPSLKFKPTP